MRSIVLAALLPLAACGGWPNGSYVKMATDADAAVIAPIISTYVAQTVQRNSSVQLIHPDSDQILSPIIASNLERDGIMSSQSGTSVTYIVDTLDKGVIVRIIIGSTNEASQYLRRTPSGSLQPGGPMMATTQ